MGAFNDLAAELLRSTPADLQNVLIPFGLAFIAPVAAILTTKAWGWVSPASAARAYAPVPAPTETAQAS